MRVFWTLRAEQCVRHIADYVGADDVVAARRLVARIRDRVHKVARMPGSGRAVPEIARPDLREVLVGNYRVIYRLWNGALYVLFVVEGHKLLPEDLSGA